MNSLGEMNDWEEIRSHYPLAQAGGFFNTASFGAISRQTMESQKRMLDDILLSGTKNYDSWMSNYHSLKDSLSSYLNTPKENLVFFPDTSDGMNKISDLLSADMEVVLVKKDFPSVSLPWITRNFKIDWIEYDDFTEDYLGEIEKRLKEGKKILCLSWVFYNHGFTIDTLKVGALCEKYDAYFVLDATQGLGAFKIDVQASKINCMVSSCFKWFMAGYGPSVGYISKPTLDRFDIKQSGWNMLHDFTADVEDESNYKTGSIRFESGHSKFQNINMLFDSFSQMNEIGLDEISSRTSYLVNLLSRKLSENGFEMMLDQNPASGILALRSNESILNKISGRKIACSARKDYVRFAVYFYNNEQDIDDLIKCLKH
ncbi:MAG: cysteine desulfurase/selenocysteine lyase [Cyclobacteriaceae bacterium]|jgi:selenocysteine lyase/cysteine desulfurase